MANLSINRSKQLKNQQFYAEISQKKTIILHHTAGMTADGAINWWNQTPEAVGTAYVIDRDGTIYEVFNPDCWAWSLGIGNRTLEKQTVAIEIVSAGQLVQEGAQFKFYPLFPSKIGGQVVPNDEVITFDTPYKGCKYYHKYTDAQVQSTLDLVKSLVDKYQIQVQDLKDFWIYNPKVSAENRPGIYSHTTVLQEKSDIFPQPNLIEGLNKLFTKKATKVKGEGGI